MLRRFPALISLLVSFTPWIAGQDITKDNLFTINIAPPTLAKNVQVRYFLAGEFKGAFSATTADGTGSKIIIRTDHENKVATSFKAIAYAPGCQFVTISVDDLTVTREGQFECQKLSTTPLRGSIPTSALQGKDFQVEVLYVCDWAQQFFNLSHAAISPFVLTKVAVAADGTFTIDLPDFASDPSWSSFSSDASLKFYLVDPATGSPVSELAPPASFSTGNNLKVGINYPGEMQFTVVSATASR